MDPQNSGPDCILCHNLKVLLRQSFNSLSQVSVVACSSLSGSAPCASFLNSVMTEFFSSAYSLCRDKVSFVTTDLSLAL